MSLRQNKRVNTFKSTKSICNIKGILTFFNSKLQKFTVCLLRLEFYLTMESSLRGQEFVTRKIIIGLVKILKNKIDYFELGNLYAKRDWGYAKEYVEAMWKMLQMKNPDDYVISTGKTYSIKDFINKATKYLGMNVIWKGKGLKERLINKDNNKTIIKINPKYFRPAEVNILKGHSKKAQSKLKWKPKTSLDQLIKIMIDDEIRYNY